MFIEAPLGATWKEYATPLELEISLALAAINMALLAELRTARRTPLKRTTFC